MNFYSIHVRSRECLLDDGSRLGDAWFPQLEAGTGFRGPGDSVGWYRLTGLRLLGRCDFWLVVIAGAPWKGIVIQGGTLIIPVVFFCWGLLSFFLWSLFVWGCPQW